METNVINEKVKWAKGLWNGIAAWLFAFFIFLIPGFVIGFKMGFELGPTSNDPGKLGEHIGAVISDFYQENVLLKIGFIFLAALLIFVRAKSTAKNTGNKKIINGMLVTVFPILFTLLLIINTGFYVTTIIELIIFPAAAYMGGKLSKQEFTSTADISIQPQH